MDPRDRWQALQARLTAARAAVEIGDQSTALREISAALALDKDFLAAQALRDRIVSMSARGHEPRTFPQGLRTDSGAVTSSRSPAASSVTESSPASAASPGELPALATAYGKFEQRARRRRVDRRLDAARLALDQRRLKAAAAALDEVIDLDPNLPELAELTVRFDDLRRATATRHRGPWVVAAAVFIAALLGTSWLQDSSPMLSRQIVSAAPLPPALPAPLAPIVSTTDRPTVSAGTEERQPVEPVAIVDTRLHAREAAASLAPTSTHAAPSPTPTAPLPRATEAGYVTTESLPVVPPPTAMPAAATPPAAAAMPTTVAAVPAAAPISAPISPSVEPPDESRLVRQTLQRYRSAYEGLDAQSARAVWPSVNETALARAFEGLESQSLSFDACDVRLRGEMATAICRGSARYVPKIGNRDPRVERRVWNFALHKVGADWKIDSARADK